MKIRKSTGWFFWLLGWSCFSLLMSDGSIWGEEYVIGEKDHQWKSVATPKAASGATISFQETLDKAFFPKAGDGRNWIAPVRTDETKNLAAGPLLTLEKRGGSLVSPNTFDLSADDLRAALAKMIDGDPTTAFERKKTAVTMKVEPFGVIIVLDLGAPFGVSKIQFWPRDFARDDYIKGFELGINDGLKKQVTEAGSPIYTIVLRNLRNGKDSVIVTFPVQYVRYIRLLSQTAANFEIAEIQVFGTGFVPVASFVSQPIKLDDISNWGGIRWGETLAGSESNSRVRVITRTGSDATPDLFTRINIVGNEVPWKKEGSTVKKGATYRDKDGFVRVLDADKKLDDIPIVEAMEIFNGLAKTSRDSLFMTEEDFEKLGISERRISQTDLENWDEWQFAVNGERITSKGPRQFFQFRVDFENSTLDAARAIDWLSFEFSNPPVAHEIGGEIAPLGQKRVRPGVSSRFVYAMLPRIIEKDTGFNRVAISTPAQVVRDDIESVEIGGKPVPKDSVTFQSSEQELLLGLPLVTVDSTLVKIVFNARVLRFGTVFGGRVFLDENGDGVPDTFPNHVEPKDVANLGVGDGNALSVEIDISEGAGGLVSSVAVSPNPFTPNGDGINDIAVISYNILQLVGAKPVTVSVHDLKGRLVRQFTDKVASGEYQRVWDGKDEHGAVAPPGMYILRVAVDTDAGESSQSATVGIVY